MHENDKILQAVSIVMTIHGALVFKPAKCEILRGKGLGACCS